MKYFDKGNFYPPVEHEERLDRYADNKLLFEGDHKALVDKAQINPRGKFYVSLNLAGLISKKSADFLIGEGINVSAGKEEDSPEQKALERIYANNNLDVRLYESALGNSYRGDSFFKVRYGHEIEDIAEGVQIGSKEVWIEPIPAKFVFPEESVYNQKYHVGYHIAIPIRLRHDKDGQMMGDWALDVESHFPNRIVKYRRAMRVIETDVTGVPRVWKIGDYMEEPVGEDTGINMPLVVHIPNYTTDDRSIGLDDLTELRPMFDELNNRFSQISNILDKHSDPAMAIPTGIMEVDEMGRPIFKVAESKVFEIDGKDDVIPQYITWNGQLQEAYSEIDRLTNEILTIAEIPEVALGKSGSGTSGSSGYAMKMRMNSLLSKIQRKQLYYEEGLKKILTIAQLLEHESGKDVDYEVTVPKLTFSDGLPKDRAEETNILLQQSGSAILKSQLSAIMELEGMTEEQALAEIERIRQEEKEERKIGAESTGDGDVFNRLTELYGEIDEDSFEVEKEEMIKEEVEERTDMDD